MVYNNFIKRSATSIFLFSFFLYIVFYYSEIINYIVLFVFFIIIFEILFYFKKLKVITIIYLLLSLLCYQYYFIYNYDKFIFFFFIIALIFFDIFSYIIGSYFGKIKLIPNISPNKTIEGLIGGLVISTILVNFLYYFFFNNLSFVFFIFISLNIILGFFGDMIESFLKRKSSIKDSGTLLPGHGGFFDRFDSFILSSYMLPFTDLII